VVVEGGITLGAKNLYDLIANAPGDEVRAHAGATSRRMATDPCPSTAGPDRSSPCEHTPAPPRLLLTQKSNARSHRARSRSRRAPRTPRHTPEPHAPTRAPRPG